MAKVKLYRGVKLRELGLGPIGLPSLKIGNSQNFWNKKLVNPTILDDGYAAKVVSQVRAVPPHSYYAPPYNIKTTFYDYSMPVWTVPANYPTRTVYFGDPHRTDCMKGTGNFTSGSNQVTSVSSTAWVNGERIYSPYVPDGTTVVSGGGTSTLTLSNNALGTIAGTTLYYVRDNNWIVGLQTVCLDVPVPRLADLPAGHNGQLWADGTDAACVIYQPSTNRSWEFWKFGGNEVSGFKAAYGGRVDNIDTGDGTIPNTWGVRSCSLNAMNGLMTVQEYLDGEFPHALAIALPVTAPFHVPPATRHDTMALVPNGSNIAGAGIAAGMKFRFNPSTSTENPAWPEFTKMVYRSGRDYGLVQVDTSGIVQFWFEDPRTVGTQFNRARTMAGVTTSDLNALPWESLQRVAA